MGTDGPWRIGGEVLWSGNREIGCMDAEADHALTIASVNDADSEVAYVEEVLRRQLIDRGPSGAPSRELVSLATAKGWRA